MRFKKNSVKGTRRGSRYPEEVKTAAIADMLVSRNLSDVAKRHGVPESTLRTWFKRIKTDADKKDTFERARADALREVNARAARAVNVGVRYMADSLELSEKNRERTQALVRQMDTEMETEGYLKHETEEMMNHNRMNHGTMSPFAVTNTTRTLMYALEKSGKLLGDDTENENTLAVKLDLVE